MNNNLQFDLSDDTPEQDADFVVDSLRQFNLNAAGIGDSRPLNIIVRDPQADNQIVAGILAETWHNTCHIRILWIAESHRRTGLGSKLLADVEAEAINRGCDIAHLDTYSFQAPDFYPKHGYTPEYTNTAFPNSIFKRYYTKPLATP